MASPITIYSPYSTYRTPAEPTAIRKYYNDIIGGITSPISPIEEREGVVHTVAESAATGAALGAIHAKLPNGLDVGKAPIDAISGVLAVLAAKAMHGKVGRSIHAIGDRAISVWAFRSTAKLLAAKSAIHGDEMSGDPLIDAAKDL